MAAALEQAGAAEYDVFFIVADMSAILAGGVGGWDPGRPGEYAVALGGRAPKNPPKLGSLAQKDRQTRIIPAQS